MCKRFLLTAGTLAAFVPTLAAAQQRPATAMGQREGSVEFSVLPAVLRFDSDLRANLASYVVGAPIDAAGVGAGLRVGYNFSKNLGLSAAATFSKGDLTTIAPAVSVVYTMDLNRRVSPYVIAGGGITYYRDLETFTGTGLHAGLGVRSFFGDNLAFRIEGRLNAESFSEERAGTTDYEKTALNVLASAGLSYFMGGGPPVDTDGDMIADRRDRCADTPRGATVDARGCPSDGDGDRVFDGLDRCPNTPANTPVDAAGCTRDSDRDGIADNLDRCANTPAGTRVDARGCPVDSDADGVPDASDRCANTPAGTQVDANGCPVPRDSDGDGVMDDSDRCPNTATGTPVDANGCPRDSDGDGVLDNADRCPNTAAGTAVDANGCPVQRDDDRDGVINANDRCANTPAGARVDASGCPLFPLPGVGESTPIRNVLFRPGSAILLPSSRATLDQVATAMQASPDARWEVGGHTDATGLAAQNQRLSQARAQAVADYFVSRGVARDNVSAVGYGSTRPVASNATPSGRAQNRRVELKRVQ